MMPFPSDRNCYRDHRDDEESGNEMAAEPIIALPTIQHDLEAGEADRDQHNPDAVDTELTAAPRLEPLLGKLRWVVNEPARKGERQQPNRNINEEHPTPRE